MSVILLENDTVVMSVNYYQSSNIIYCYLIKNIWNNYSKTPIVFNITWAENQRVPCAKYKILMFKICKNVLNKKISDF